MQRIRSVAGLSRTHSKAGASPLGGESSTAAAAQHAQDAPDFALAQPAVSTTLIGPQLNGSGAEVASSTRELHPRGHEALHKRVRHAVLWVYNRCSERRAQLLAAVVVAVLLLAWLTLRLFTLNPSLIQAAPEFAYAVYIDAGSSGTRVHVFQYAPPRRWPEYAEVRLPERTRSVEPGLSTYAGRPEQAAASLAPLLDFARQEVPPGAWASTPLFLLATAGLRLLSAEDAADILAASSRFLAESEFAHKPGWAQVISGDAEGVFAWTAVNYVTGALQDAVHHHHLRVRKEMAEPESYAGVLELGGASFQVTFMPPTPTEIDPAHGGSQVPLPGVSRRVFTHSFLGLGMDAAMQRAADLVLHRAHQREASSTAGASPRPLDPCLPAGYQAQDGRRGAANFYDCLNVVQEVLPARRCHAAAPTPAGVARTLHPLLALPHSAAGSDTTPSQGTASGGPQSAGWEIADVGGRGAVAAAGCSFAGVVLPATATTRFVAVENFYWTARALGLGPRSTLAELRDAGVAYCSRSWSALHEQFQGTVADQFVARYCFGAAYTYLLLRDRLGIGEHQRMLHFTNTIRRKRREGRGPARGADAEPHNGVGSPALSHEVDVGLSWVVGAVLVHAMATGRSGMLALSAAMAAGDWDGATRDGRGFGARMVGASIALGVAGFAAAALLVLAWHACARSWTLARGAGGGALRLSPV